MIKVKDIIYNYDIYLVEDKIVCAKISREESASVSLVNGEIHRVSVEDAKKVIQELEKKVS